MTEVIPHINLEHQEPPGGILETRRWWILLSLSVFSCANSICWLSYTPIPVASKAYFGANDQQILLFTNSYLFCYIIFSFLGSWFASKALKVSLLSYMAIATVGAWTRYFAGDNYVVAIIGQFTVGIATAATIGFATGRTIVLKSLNGKVISEEWFAAREKALVRFISMTASYLGWFLGFVIPCKVVDSDPAKISTNELAIAIVFIIPLGMGALCLKDKPASPPSLSALLKQSSQFPNLGEEIKHLLSIPRFARNAVLLSSIIGLSYTIPIVSGLILTNLGYNDIDYGLLGVLYIAGGYLGKVLGRLIIRVIGEVNSDIILKFMIVSSTVCLVISGVKIHILMEVDMSTLYILIFFLGFGLLGFVPFACDSLSQSTYPVGEITSTNALLTMAALFGIIETSLMTTTFVKKSEFLILAMISIPSFLYVLFFYKTEYKRERVKVRNMELDKEFEKFYHDERGFRSISPIKEKVSVSYLPYSTLSVYSKDLIMSTPNTPLVRSPPKLPRSFSGTEHDKKSKNESEKLVELVNIN